MTLSIMTWNIRQGGGGRLPGLLGVIRRCDPDVLVLTEYRNHAPGSKLRALLTEDGWCHQSYYQEATSTNSVLLASKLPFQAANSMSSIGADQHRCVQADFGRFRLYGVYFALGERKRNLWQYLIAEAKLLLDQPAIFMGDFNTGRQDLDRSGGTTFHCAEYMDQIEAVGWKDAWRGLHGEAREYSWYSNAGNGFRLDHAFVSPMLAHQVCDACYHHVDRESKVSDHSPLVLRVAVGDL